MKYLNEKIYISLSTFYSALGYMIFTFSFINYKIQYLFKYIPCFPKGIQYRKQKIRNITRGVSTLICF